MVAKKVPKIVVQNGEKGKKKKVIPVLWKGKGAKPFVRSDFEPRVKDPGDLIMAEEWNDIQEEIKDDLLNLVYSVEALSTKSSTIIASGIASHGVFVELTWGVQPHVILSPSGTLNEIGSNVYMICYPHDISSKGFRIFARTRDGKVEGIVNWLAIGVS